MNRFHSLLALVSLALAAPRAEDLNLNEKADTVRVALSPYSLGIGAGAIAALNPELKRESEMFAKIGIVQSVAMNDFVNVGFDLDWLFPGANWDAMLNLDYTMGPQHFKPFIGVSGGAQYFHKDGRPFGEGFGVAAGAHIGMLIDVMDELQLRIRVPFVWAANHDGDRSVGLDLGLFFSSPHRHTKVKKLIY
jgi:hypothetical protein